MKPPEINRDSAALHKQLMAAVRASAVAELEKRMKSLPVTERAKLKRFLKNIKFLGDVGKAADKTRVSRALLDKWMDTPGINWHINTAFNEAQCMSHSGTTAEDVLFGAKVVPELEKDAEHFKKTGQRHRESKVIAKLASKNLKEWRWQIAQAANNSDRHFFIDLGRILDGDASADLYDSLNCDVAELYTKNPVLSTRRAAAELQKRGHTDVEEHTVRQRKTRLGLTNPRALQKVTKSPS